MGIISEWRKLSELERSVRCDKVVQGAKDSKDMSLTNIIDLSNKHKTPLPRINDGFVDFSEWM